MVGLNGDHELGDAFQSQGFGQRGAGEAGHVGAAVEIVPSDQAGLQAEVAAPAGHWPPGVMHQRDKRPVSVSGQGSGPIPTVQGLAIAGGAFGAGCLGGDSVRFRPL